MFFDLHCPLSKCMKETSCTTLGSSLHAAAAATPFIQSHAHSCTTTTRHNIPILIQSHVSPDILSCSSRWEANIGSFGSQCRIRYTVWNSCNSHYLAIIQSHAHSCTTITRHNIPILIPCHVSPDILACSSRWKVNSGSFES